MIISVVAAQKTHAMLVICGFQSGETSSIPGASVPHAPDAVSAYTAFTPFACEGFSVPTWHSQRRTGQRDRRETHPDIGGPDGPGGVESSISTLLSP
jgi:hypothetical protein